MAFPASLQALLCIAAFEKYRPADARVMLDKITNRSRGFGFVTFNDKALMEKAVAEMHEVTIENRKISVNKAIPQSETAPGTPAAALARGGSRDRWVVGSSCFDHDEPVSLAPPTFEQGVLVLYSIIYSSQTSHAPVKNLSGAAPPKCFFLCEALRGALDRPHQPQQLQTGSRICGRFRDTYRSCMQPPENPEVGKDPPGRH